MVIYRYLGKHKHTETLSGLITVLTSAKLLGMTGSPIGKSSGLKARETIEKLMRFPVATKL